MPAIDARARMQDLRRRLQLIHQAQRGVMRAQRRLFSSGLETLDRLLPEGGLPRACLLEWLAEPAGGAATLSLLAAREALREGGTLVVIDGQRRFYPPAAAALGVPLGQMLVVRPRTAEQELWAVDQALRCRGVAVVWAALERQERRLRERVLRRWQLAAEASGAVGMLLRPRSAIGKPHWAEARWETRAAPPPAGCADGRWLLVRLLRCGALGSDASPAVVQLETPPACTSVGQVTQRNPRARDGSSFPPLCSDPCTQGP